MNMRQYDRTLKDKDYYNALRYIAVSRRYRLRGDQHTADLYLLKVANLRKRMSAS